MESNPKLPRDIDEYIAGFSEEVREILEKVRATIRKAVPDAAEAIKYGIPTFTLNGNLLSFAGYLQHLGVYPAPRGNEKLDRELAPFRSGQSTLRFPLDQPIPYALIGRVAKVQAAKYRARAETKGRKA